MRPTTRMATLCLGIGCFSIRSGTIGDIITNTSAVAINLASKGELAELQLVIEIAQNVIDNIKNNSSQSSCYLRVASCLLELLSKRYECLGSSTDVELGIKHGRTALSLVTSKGVGRQYLIRNLAIMYYTRYDYQREVADLDEAIRHIAKVLPDMPQDDPLRHELGFSSGFFLLCKYQNAPDPTVLDACIRTHENALSVTPANHPQHNHRMASLANALIARYNDSGSLDDLCRSIDVMEQVIRKTAAIDPVRPHRLQQLSFYLGNRYECNGNIADLDEAIKLSKEAETLTDESHEERPDILNLLVRWLAHRHKQAPDTDDLEQAVKVVQAALDLRPNSLNIITTSANLFAILFDHTNNIADLDHCILLNEKGRQLSMGVDPTYPLFCCNLAQNLSRRFSRSGKVDDLERAISTAREAVFRMGKHHTYMTQLRIGLAADLASRFEQTTSIDDIQDALRIGEEFIEDMGPNHPCRADGLARHGVNLAIYYRINSDVKILDKAIQLFSESISIDPVSHNNTPSRVFNYAQLLAERFQLTRHIGDLNQAIELTTNSINSIWASESDKRIQQAGLAQWLGFRFGHTGALQDLEHAITAVKSAFDTTSGEDPARPLLLGDLARFYEWKYGRTKHDDDLSNSIEMIETALNIMPQNHIQRPRMMITLASLLAKRGGENDKDDIDKSILLLENCISDLPETSSVLASALESLGKTLRNRYGDFTWEYPDDIDRSVEVLQVAVNVAEGDPTLHALCLFQLGVSYDDRFNYPDNPVLSDRQNASDAWVKCFNTVGAPVAIRIQASRRAAPLLVSLARPLEAISLLREAIELYPILCPRNIARSDQEHVLKQIHGISSMAAAIAIEHGNDLYEALVLLEHGRGVIANMLMETRMDLSELDPITAADFIETRKKLEMPQFNPSNSLSQIEDEIMLSSYLSRSKTSYDAEIRLRAIISEIRSKPETRGFLRPPSYDELREVLDDEILVTINAAAERYDAFIIDKRQAVRLVELRRLDPLDIFRRVEGILSSRPQIDLTMLEWLWDKIASPILQELGFGSSSPKTGLPHIVWILTGRLSRLPIHAAGRHMEDNKDTVLDRVISSYSLSLRAFVHSKKTRLSTLCMSDAASAKKEALLVSMSKTAGLGDLPYATKEIEKIRTVCPSLKLAPVTLSHVTREAVLSRLGASIFHFAGHGKSDPLNPSQSGLQLEDGLLTVADIQRYDSGNNIPFLGYLSACLTGFNEVDNLVDEGIHLIGAFQLAGFRHVIGTLWEVRDEACVRVAESVYEEVAKGGLTDPSVHTALHRAVVHLRDEWVAERGSKTSTSVPALRGRNREVVADELVKGQHDDQSREGRLRLRKAQGAIFVRADWVSYVHYGP